jgi:hypothetical protein
MAKVLGIHEIELRDDVKAEDFERFVIEEVLPLGALLPGVKQHLLKGDRGNRYGKYVFLFEFASVESRNRFFPAPDQPSDEAKRYDDSVTALGDEWARFVSFHGPTDYVIVDE